VWQRDLIIMSRNSSASCISAAPQILLRCYL
jgi:hypothetical protein